MLRAIYVVTFFISFNYNITTYVNSGYLKIFLAEKYIGVVYAVAALITLLFLLNTPRLLRRLGGYHLTVLLLGIGGVSSLVIVLTSNAWLAILFFIAQIAVIRLVEFDVDLFLKNLTDTKRTGTARGILYTVINVSAVLGPLLAGYLVTDEHFGKIYLTSGIVFFLALAFLLLKFKYYRDVHYLSVGLKDALRHMRTRPDLRRAVSIRFALSFLFAWTAVYIPLYLFSDLGFSWRQINFIFAITLFFFLLIELPLGEIADRYSAEKKIMLGGGILAMSVLALMPFVTVSQFWLWSVILVALGIGSCAIEIGIETYFFRNIHKNDADFVSIFRTTNPISELLSMVVASVFLIFVPLRYLFWLLLPLLLWQVWVTGRISSLPGGSDTVMK